MTPSGRGLLVAGFAAGCLAPRDPLPDTGTTAAPTSLPLPDLEYVSIACRPREGLWRMQLRTSGWVGRARTYWTTDGIYVEAHNLLSHAYDPDGTGEVLFLDLPVAPDLSLVESGGATAFSCGDDPSILWTIAPPERGVSACAHTGPSFEEWNEVEGVPSCP